MKNNIKVGKLFLSSILCFSMMIPSFAFAASSNYDPIEEAIKHVKNQSNYQIEKSVHPYIVEDTGISEYRMADEQAAILLSEMMKDDDRQNYYDITVSFEKSHRIESMYTMLEIYDAVDNKTKKSFKSYLLSYAPYSDDSALLEQVNDLVAEKSQVSPFSNYDRLDAANWAYNNYNNYSSNYPNMTSMGGDCANFVSQAMHAGGGMPMSGDWYCYKKNTVYPKPTTVEQLDYSWTLADPSPWISAREFKNYWDSSTKSTTYTYDLNDYKAGNTTAFSDPIYKGHAISLLNQVGWWYEAAHTMIVVDYDAANKDYIFAAHSGATHDSAVKDVGDYDQVKFYAFK